MSLRISMFLPLILLLSACSGASLNALKQADMPEDPYHSALAEQYLIMSDSEAAAGRWDSSTYFADKGLAATYGRDEWPAEPNPADKELAEAWALLLKLAVPENRKTFPHAAANAIFFYDCWSQQSAIGQAENAGICKEGFYEAAGAIERPAVAAALRPVAPDGVPEDVPLSTSYLVYFCWDESALNVEAEEVIQKAVAYIKQLGAAGYEVVVNGHTDRSGDEMYNLTLSNQRADQVKARLIEAGVTDEKITTYGFGESDPRKPTADGVREPANRRVEIFIE